jgi:hypothetical protein
MKLHEFLLEAKKQSTVTLTRGEQELLDDVLKVCELANTEAGKYMSKYKDKKDILYRGEHTAFTNFDVETVRKDRRPKDSSKNWHDLYNMMLSSFDDNPGWRNSSLFVTRDESEAGEYGDSVIVIPIGEYKILSSKMVKDMYNSFEMETFATADDIMRGAKVRTSGKSLPKKDIDTLFKLIQNSDCFDEYLKILNFHCSNILEKIGVKKKANIKIVDKYVLRDILVRLLLSGFHVYGKSSVINSDVLNRLDVSVLVNNYLFEQFGIMNELDKIEVKKPLDIDAVVYDLKDTLKYAKSINFAESLKDLAIEWSKCLARLAYDLDDNIPRHQSEIMLKCDTYIAMRMKSLDRFNDIRESNGKRTFIPESKLSEYFMKIVKQNPNSTQQIIDIIMK